jgi:hypothetical protein
VYPSTLRLWKRLAEDEGLQISRFDNLPNVVSDTFKEMHRSYVENRGKILPDRLCEIRYDDLIANPVATMREVYEHLSLDRFADAQPVMEQYADSMAEFKTNQYTLTDDDQDRIDQLREYLLSEHSVEARAA